jgi:hypothetical protein
MRTPPPNLSISIISHPQQTAVWPAWASFLQIVGLHANQLFLVHAKNNPLFRHHSPLQILNLASADV